MGRRGAVEQNGSRCLLEEELRGGIQCREAEQRRVNSAAQPRRRPGPGRPANRMSDARIAGPAPPRSTDLVTARSAIAASRTSCSRPGDDLDPGADASYADRPAPSSLAPDPIGKYSGAGSTSSIGHHLDPVETPARARRSRGAGVWRTVGAIQATSRFDRCSPSARAATTGRSREVPARRQAQPASARFRAGAAPSRRGRPTIRVLRQQYDRCRRPRAATDQERMQRGGEPYVRMGSRSGCERASSTTAAILSLV